MNEETLKELQVVVGRLNAVHAGLCVIARALPAPVAQEAAKQMQAATERVHADALALPIPDAQVHEMHRVLEELTRILTAASQPHQ